MIKHTYDDEKQHVHILSYGGGTQSTALLLLALEGKVNGIVPDYIVFSDTGWEPQHVYDWVHKVNTYIKERYDREIIIAQNGNLRDDLINAVDKGSRVASLPYFTVSPEGKKGMSRRQCTSDYKIVPVRRKIRELLGYKPRQRITKEHVHLWKGISTDEIQRVKPMPDRWIDAEHPLIDILDMDRDACIAYVESTGLGTPPQSSCVGCPFHNDILWADMKRNDPVSFEDACEIDDKIRNIPGMRGACYLHRSRTPLRDVVFSDEETDDFGNECEGMCGM